MARLFVKQGDLKLLECPVPIPNFEVRAHWHARQQASPAHRWFRDELVQVLSGL